MKKHEICAIICSTEVKERLTLIKFFKNIPHFIGIISCILYIVSLAKKVANGEGTPMLNYVLLAVSAVFLLIYIIMLLRGQDKQQVKSAKRYYKWFKLGMKGVSFFIIIYEFVTLSSDASMLMPSILIVLWIIQINGEIMKYRARKRRERIKAKIDSVKNRFKKQKTNPKSEAELELTVAPVDTIEFIDEEF